MNLQTYFSLKIHQADLAAPTNETFCLVCGFQRDLLVLPPVEKIWMAVGRDGGKGGGVTVATNDAEILAADRGEGGEEREGGRWGRGKNKL